MRPRKLQHHTGCTLLGRAGRWDVFLEDNLLGTVSRDRGGWVAVRLGRAVGRRLRDSAIEALISWEREVR